MITLMWVAVCAKMITLMWVAVCAKSLTAHALSHTVRAASLTARSQTHRLRQTVRAASLTEGR
jgi:hypothetical protein